MLNSEDLAVIRPALTILSFVLGAVVGSFLNVCIYRIPAGKSLSWPGSHCYSCGSFLAWYDNIPIVSYFVLRGRCRSCASPYSIRYALIELLTACLFLATFLLFGPTIAVPLHCVFIAMMIVGTFTDIDHFIIPDRITLGGVVFALAAALIGGGATVIAAETRTIMEFLTTFQPFMGWAVPEVGRGWAFAGAVVGAGFGWLLLYSVGLFGRLLFRKEAMGYGDVKLFAFLGAYLGPIMSLYVLALASVLGAVVGGLTILAHRFRGQDEFEEIELVPPAEAGNDGAGEPLRLSIARRTSSQLHQFPFGPYIAVAAVAVLLASDWLHRFTRDILLLY